MNTVNLIGTIAKAPARYGEGKVKFKIQCTRTLGERRTIDTIPCVAFGPVADGIEKEVHLGERWLASGRWSVSSYVTVGGERVSSSEMIVTMMAKPISTIKFHDEK